MTVRCKFKCVEKQDGNLTFETVTGDSPENASFFKYTPSGSIKFYTVNEAALAQFEVGKPYYVDLVAAD